MADESELSRFREQWKEEVTARTQGRGRTLSTSASSSTRPRLTHAHRVLPGKDDDTAATPPAPHARRASHSTATALDPETEHEVLLGDSVRHPRARRPSVIVTTPTTTALEHFETAVQKEHEGNLGDSVRHYRKAFRLDSKVDQAYREKHFSGISHGGGGGDGGSTAAGPPPAQPTRKALAGLVASFSGFAIEAAVKEVDGAETGERQFCLLAAIPQELLLQVLHVLALTDVASFGRLALVCKRLCYLVGTEESIWADVCEATYPRQVWDWKLDTRCRPLPDSCLYLSGPSEVIYESSDEEEGEGEEEAPAPEPREIPSALLLAKYNNSWRSMFRLRPRIRYNGIYISTCNYHRAGGNSANSLSWNTPLHIVTYYRYLRFYPDGSMLSLLTTHEPPEVVPSFSFSKLQTPPPPSWAQYVYRGRWRIAVEGTVELEMEPPNMPRYMFRMRLAVRNGKSRGAVRLVWEGFWSCNRLTDDVAAFEGRNDKPFFFSRVSAVERELGIV